MSDAHLPAPFPTRQAAAIPGRSERNKVTGKLKAALDAMVWEGKPRAEAAAAAGMADSSLRFALRKPHVLAHYNTELAALRTSLRARTVHRLDNIADNSKNDMARVSAMKTLEALSDQAEEKRRSGETTMLPGLTVVIAPGLLPNSAPPLPPPAVIDGQPVGE